MQNAININKINPLRKQWVEQIVNEIKNNKYVERLIIFGSSIRNDCTDKSDLDIAIKWTENCYDDDYILKSFTIPVYKVISSVTKGNNDVICIGYEGDDIKKAIEEGVVVYENGHVQ